MNRLVWVVCLVVVLGGCAPAVSGIGADELRATDALAEPVLLFEIGMHIEPLGRTAQGYGGGAVDYRQGPLFERHVQDILAVVRIIEAHGGRMTIQAQSPFTQVAVERGNTILKDLESRGHEIALHFHEDAHLGRDSERLPVQTWCAVMKEEISYIQRSGTQKKIRYWSGGNLYPGILDAASCAGLDVTSDWKNPRTQSTDRSLLGVHPWRPAGGPSETDLSKFATHDPSGKIVFLPEGAYDPEKFARKREIIAQGGDQAWFEVLREALERSLASARADRVNVFHFTVHPGEFRGDPNRPFGVIEDFLTNVVDPLVKAGKVRWATFSQMADEFIAWEKANPGVDPRRSAIVPPAPDQGSSTGYITFAINVHDFRHITESAETLLKLIAIFEKYRVRGDFYLTGPMADFYAEQRPDVIQKLKQSGMTISYHQRPPHPIYTGFDSRLKGLSDDALKSLLRDYETYKLDLATGELQRDQPGGYTYFAELMGRKPVVATAPNNDPKVKKIAWQLYKELGAQMTVIYHESGTKLDTPFEWVEGLLVRPSDFSVTRWKTERVPHEQFWWNMLDTPHAADYNPTNYLKKKLSEWRGPRPPFITVLIHEDNFFRRGATPWQSIYYGPNGQPLAPPYNLNAPDPSQPRSQQSQELIWKAYEELVAYAATHLSVVTSEDIVAMAQGALSLGEQVQPLRPTEPDVTYCVMDGVELKMDIYRPQSSAAPTPALLYVHGGGWTSGDKRSGEGVRDIPELVARGYLVAAVNYRLAPQYKFPAMIEDVKCAVRFLRANAERYNINPERIGAWGGSAGGHSVALLGTADETAGWEAGQYLEQSSRVQAVVDMFGPTDLTVLFEGANPRLMEQVFGTSDRNSETLKRASPVNWVSSDDAPFLILHGERDPLVPVSQSQIFYEKLQAANVPATLVIVKNAGHGFVPMGGPISPSREELTRMIADFFDRYLKMPASGDHYGVSQGAHRDAILMPRSFELAAQAGIGWIRFGIWYELVNPAPGFFRYEESRFDAQVRKVRQLGLEILGTLGYASSWNTSAPPGLPPGADPTHFPPRDYQAWADYVFQTVSRYKNDIQYWEVWNEPDLRGFWAGTTAQYAELLAVTYDAVKRANPNAKVVLGGLALGGPPQQLNRNFLTEILNDARYPAARYFDIMNFHHYGTREEARQKMEYVRNALRQAGASDKPIWITETGYSSDPSQQNDPNYRGLEGQAQWLRDMIPYLLELGADKVFWYRLYDYPADFNADVGYRYHGLIDNQGNPKPSYYAYKELIASSVAIYSVVFDAAVAHAVVSAKNFSFAADRFAIHPFIHVSYPRNAKVYLFDAAQRTGKKLMRQDFALYDIEPEEGHFQWRQQDENVRMAAERGLELLGTLGYAAPWIADPGSRNRYHAPINPAKLNAFAEYVRETVRRYPQVRYWEIWNEPNQERYYRSRPQEYAKLLKVAYQAVKQANPNARVLFGGAYGLEVGGPDWVRRVLTDPENPGRDNYDIANFHLRGSLQKVQAELNAVLEVYRTYGKPDAPLWITEFGYPASPRHQQDPQYRGTDVESGERAQAEYYKVALPWLLENGVDKVFVTLRDYEADGNTVCRQGDVSPFCSEGLVTFSLQSASGRDRPAMAVYQSFGRVSDGGNPYEF